MSARISKGWVNVVTEPGVVHVIPFADLVGHTPAEECVCVPAAEIVQAPDRPDGHVFTHSSLDGREARE